MPREFTKYEPDWIDVNTQLTALGEDFNVRCDFTITIERDRVVCIARCRRLAIGDNAPVEVQALSSRPIKNPTDMAVVCFALAQDCWRQLDSPHGASAQKPIAHNWNGRPHIARRDER